MSPLEVKVDALEQKVARVASLEGEVTQMRADWEDDRRAQTKLLTDLRARHARHRKAIGGMQGALNEHGQILNQHSKVIGEIQKTQLEHSMAIRQLWSNQLEISKAIGGLSTELGEFRDEILLGIAGISRSLDCLIHGQGKSPS